MPVRSAGTTPFCNRQPALAGVGLRAQHIEEVLDRRPDVAWFEVHPENYMHDPAALALLERIRSYYPVALHGVALSPGSVGPLDHDHLARLKYLVDRLDPCLVSEHMAWSRTGGAHFNDLLPLPCTKEALDTMAKHVDEIQGVLGRQILVENPSGYLRFRHSTMGEAAFLGELARRTGCGLLCDVNNIYVSSRNLDFDPVDYLDRLPAAAVGEIHLAGHAINIVANQTVLIDDHASCVSDDVWALYRQALVRFGRQPTLIEWDANLPKLDVLLAEANKAAGVAATEGHHVDAA